MPLPFKSQLPNLDGIYAALFSAAEIIYAELKKGAGLKFATSSNESGDDQIELASRPVPSLAFSKMQTSPGISMAGTLSAAASLFSA